MIKSFSKEGYRSLLEVISDSGYQYGSFEYDSLNSNKQLVFMRHDIDTDLQAAKEIALIEKEMSARSTFFLMLRSPVYNLLGRYNHRCVEAILQAGHSLGLHYDEAFYPNNGMTLQELIDTEAAFLSRMFGCRISAVSFHQPGPAVLENKIKVENFINTYDKEDFKDIFYISDSNMLWKHQTAWDLFSQTKYDKIQLLTHPMWWVGKGDENTELLWNKSLMDNLQRSLQQITETEAAFGKPRIFKLQDK